MNVGVFAYQGVTLEYYKSGHGAKILLLFHGFGQNYSAFDELTGVLSTKYTLYSFNLFFHGNSTWPGGEAPLEKPFLGELVHSFLTENQFDKCSLVGFSLGGKFALTLAESIPHCVEEIFLIAPDGIKTSFWYSLATYPVALRSLFKSMITKQKRFQRIVKLAGLLRLADRGLIRFAQTQMNTEEKRRRVYYSWVVFRHLQFNLITLASAFNQNSIPLTVIVGKFDKVITAKNMSRLTQRVALSHLEILDAGHNDLIKKSAAYFAGVWKS
jgi:pimeloyl-ACP methyl ester carboxylesterase